MHAINYCSMCVFVEGICTWYRVHVSRRGFTGLSGDEMVGRGAQIGAIRFLCDHAFVTI